MRTPQRAQVIIDLIKEHNYKRIAEIGVCKGETAMPVIEACDPDIYAMIDPKINNSLGLLEFTGKHAASCGILNMTSVDAAAYLKAKPYDLIFIDAIHTYESVAEDIRLWTPKVRVGGIICGHDYDNKRFPGVKQAVDEFYDEARIKTVKVRGCYVWIFHNIGSSW